MPELPHPHPLLALGHANGTQRRRQLHAGQSDERGLRRNGGVEVCFRRDVGRGSNVGHGRGS